MPANGLESVTKPATTEDQSYLDYLMSVRNFVIIDWFPELAENINSTVEASGKADSDYLEISDMVDDIPRIGSWKRMMRSQQALTWNKLRDSYHADQQKHLAMLDEAETATGRLHYDKDFHVPDSACYDIHLQPGGYCKDELAGFIFEPGPRVFYQGMNDNDELHKLYVDMLKQPADGKVTRILDLGCSIGQCTTAFKDAYPEAEVWGIDVALPLLRYANYRANELQSEVHFQQALAENLPQEDSSFDAVFAYILFHETPEHTFAPILEEAMRVLRPGGTLTIVDAPLGTSLPAANRMWQKFDAQYNCEPYAPAFVESDFPGLIKAAGFDDIEQAPTPTFLSLTTAVKPA